MARFKVTFILLYLITILSLLFTTTYATELVNNKDSIEDGKDIVKTDNHLDVRKEEKLDVSFDKVVTTDSAVSLEHENHGSSGEHFIAVPAHNLGAVENLDPSLKGLTGIVTSKLPASVRLVRIVDATREVVAGIRYDFTLEVVNISENSEPYLCAYALLERPWIKTEWGSKERSVILNNCTIEDKIVEEKPIVQINNKPSFVEKESKISDNTENNELTASLNNIDKVNPPTESSKVEVNYDTVAEFGHIEEIADAMSPERLKDMEEQIIAKAEPHYVETVTMSLKEEYQGEDLRIEEESTSPTTSSYYIESVTDIIKEEDKILGVKIDEQDGTPTEAYNIETVTLILQEEPKVEVIKLESNANEETNPKVEPCNIETVTAIIERYEPIKIDIGRKPDEDKIILKKDALDGLHNWLNNVRILEKSPKHHTIDNIKYKSLETDPHKPVAGETLDALKEYLDDVRIKNKEIQATEKSEELTQTEGSVTQIVDTEKLSALEGLLDLLEEPKATKIEQLHTETEQEQRVPVEEIFVAEKAFTVGTKTDSDASDGKSSESSEESNENKISSSESSEEDIVTSYVTRRRRSFSKDLIMKLANNAINALDHIDSDNRKRVVLDILDSKQKIKSDGTYFTIKVRIATTDCSETVENISKCSKMLIKDTIKICNIEIKKNGDEERVIKSQCTPVRKLNRSKRHSLKGGVSPADPNDPYVQEMLTDATGKLQSYHRLQHPLNVKVNSVTKQVVAGMLYKYEIEIDNNEFEKQTCTISIWDRSWLPDGREITTECGSPNSNAPRNKIEFKKKTVEKRSINNFEETNKRIRVKRQRVGAAKPVDPNDPYVQEILTNIKGNLQSYHQLQHPLNINVISVTKTPVAGSLYKYEIEIDNNEFDKQACLVSVWDRPWIPNGREINAECGAPNAAVKDKKIKLTNRRKRETLVGGVSPADPNDSYVQEVLLDIKEKLQSYHRLQNELNVKLLSVTQQLVAGVLYKYEIEINNDDFDKQRCFVSVWDRLWIEDGREITAECGEPNSNVRNKIQFKKSQKKRSMYDFETDHFDLLSTMDDEELMKLSSFDSFIREYNKTYSRNEFLFRFNVFKQNLERINKLNRNEMGSAIYGINEFSDLTRKEFKIHTGLLPREEETNEVPRALAELFENDPLPESFDWRERGVVSPVKNQGSCGSCWAFSVTGNIEGLNAIKTGKLEEFSEQELLDCDSIDAACNGGLPDNAYKAIEQIGGLESETDYPYEGRKEKTCHFNSTLSKVKVKGAIDLPKNETKIAQFLVLNGPISIGINANAMQFYRGGVSHPWKALCNPEKLDHGVLIVGYGTHSYPKFKKDLPYWIIKNSWGPSWGEQGYYRVYRGDGTCGVDQMASSAIIE